MAQVYITHTGVAAGGYVDESSFAGVWQPAGWVIATPPADAAPVPPTLTSLEAQLMTLAAQQGYTTKRCAVPLTGCGTIGLSTALTDVCQRVIMLLPTTTTRWRLRIRNIGYASGGNVAAVQSGAINFLGVWYGTPVVAASGSLEGQAAGTFTAAPTQVITPFVTDAAGDEYITSWVNDPGLQFEADQPSLLSWGFTAAAGQQIPYSYPNTANVYFGAGSSAQAGNAAAPSGSSGGIVGCMDIRLEYETFSNKPVGLIIGDSLSEGWIDRPGISPSGEGAYELGPHIPWPGRAALAKRLLINNAGIGAQSYGSAFAMLNNWAYQRFDLATTVPDFVVLACGNKEAETSLPLATFLTNLAAVIAIVKALGINRIYVATCWPRPENEPGILTAGVASGATSISTTVPYVSGDVITLECGSDNLESVTASAASTGNGPYATTVSATAKAHPMGSVTGNATYAVQTQFDMALREGAFVTDGVFDIAQVFPPGTSLTRWWGSTAPTHPGAAAYALVGSLFPFSGRS